jgi:nitroreductase
MDLIEGLKTRRSVRSYQDRKVPDTVIEALLETARWAPSAVNNQPWRFCVIKDKERKAKLRGGLRDALIPSSKHILEAPVVLVAWYTPALFFKKFQVSDVSNAIMHVLLAAHAHGLGTCWIGWFSEDRVKKVAALPKKASVVALITVGYPEDVPEPKERKSVKDIAYRETYDNPW